jgi:hypothetical protein
MVVPVLKVNTFLEQQRFDHIWMPSWIEAGYELESYITEGVERFIFYDEIGDFGSIEIVPYDLQISRPINKVFPFYQFSELNGTKTMEIEKLTVRKEVRGSPKYLLEMFLFLAKYSNENNYKYWVSLMNPELYNALVWKFSFPAKKLALVGGNDLSYYPVLINGDHIKDLPIFKRLMRKNRHILNV